MGPKTSEELISVVRAITICTLAFILVIALCATFFFKNYADPTVLVTIVGALNLLLGYLAGKRSVGSEQGPPTDTVNVPLGPKLRPTATGGFEMDYPTK